MNAGWIVAALAWSVFAGVVLDEYGWYRSFNSAIPLAGAIIWVGVIALAAWGAGQLLVSRRLDVGSPTLERITLKLLAGTAVLIATAGILAALRLLWPPLVLAALALWACRGAVMISRRHRTDFKSIPQVPLPWFALILFAGGLSLAAATTLAPFYDQWHYHLGFPHHWLRTGTVVTFPRQAYSFFPANMGLLYTFALAGPGGWAAQAIHWWMGSLTAAGSAAIAQRLGAGVGGRFLSAAILLTTPSVVQMAALAGSDLGVAAFASGGVLIMLRMIQTPGQPWPLAFAAGLAAGLAAGCKYSALATVVLPLGAVVVATNAFAGENPGRLRRATRTAVAFGLGVGIVVAPWFIRNSLVIGNPVHPYFESVFADESPPPPEGGRAVASGVGTFQFDAAKITTALTLGTFSRRGLAGDLGLVYLLLLPPVIIWAWYRRRRAGVVGASAFAALAIIAWVAGPPLGRYLLPVLSVLSAAIGAMWSEAHLSRSPPLRSAATLVLFVMLAANSNPVRGEYLIDQLRCFLGAEDTDRYLARYCNQLEPFHAANTRLPYDAKVLLVGEPRPYQIDRDVVVEDQFRVPLLVELANHSSTPDEIAARLQEMGVTHLLWNSAEAARIAEAENRSGFLVCDSESSQARLNQFTSRLTTPFDEGEWWQIVTLAQP